MILVLLGTTNFDFSRLLKVIDELLKDETIKDDVIVQSGFTKFTSSRYKDIGLVSMKELDRLIKDAKIIISHAGTGSLVSAVKSSAAVIAAPRYKSMNEHIDDHQLDITREFVSLGYVLPYFIDDDLGQVIKNCNEFQKKEFISGKAKIIDFINEYLDQIQ